MPLYNFECDCGNRFEELCRVDDDVRCPACDKLTRRMPSRLHFVFDKHMYKTFLKAEDERSAAEEQSHMGKMPYNPLDETEV